MKKRILSLIIAVIMSVSVIIPITSVTASAEDLSEYEQRTYLKNGDSPMDKASTKVTMQAGVTIPEHESYSLSLNGTWKASYISNASSSYIAGEGWDRAINATVPGSIYTALVESEVIKDPYLGTNMKDANKYSSKHWYFKTEFDYAGSGKNVMLDFDGVCSVCEIYLNGKKVATHDGMFGGPYVDVTSAVQTGKNTLIVHIYPAKDYTKTVVFNCSYGWHYAKLYPLGIWRSVTIRDAAPAELDSPFISTSDYKNGTVDLSIDLTKKANGKLYVVISPANFEGKDYGFTYDVNNTDNVRVTTNVPEFKLWWPNGYGEQNLYKLKTLFVASDGTKSYSESQFGIRQLEMAPFKNWENASTYNRLFVINGREIYMKGANWCTIDAMMRFTTENYDKQLSRARDAGMNFFRSWGGGLVETEEFYDLCDEYGICIYQEWPCGWDSQKTQPEEALYETVILNTKRLRNRASLVVYGGGNEGEASFDDTVLNNMGKLTYEYDGTRDFWRQDGGTASSGISHDHIHWSGDTPEHYISVYSDILYRNFMEYGLDSMMNLDSIAKYATTAELSQWPIASKNSIAFHTATFNGWTNWTQTPYGYDIDCLIHYAGQFTTADTLEKTIVGSQLAQAQADYLPAMNSRIKFPYNTTNTVYKLNDVYPGASWSIVDWYGAPKIAYYMMQDAYRTLMAAPKLNAYNTIDANGVSSALDIPVYVLDDNATLAGKSWTVKVTAYNSMLETVSTQEFKGSGHSDYYPISAGNFKLTAEQTDSTPLIIAFDLYVDGKYENRTFVYFNYEMNRECLFWLPRTSLEYTVAGNVCTVKNAGTVPAIDVYFDVADTSEFVCSDSYFMLNPGETVEITVNDGAMIKGVNCFNLKDSSDVTPPQMPMTSTVREITNEGAKVEWEKAIDDKGVFAYNIYANGKLVKTVFGNQTEAVLTGLDENTEYSVQLETVDNAGNVSKKTTIIKFTTSSNTTNPTVTGASLSGNTLTLEFDRKMEKESVENKDYYITSSGISVASVKLQDNGTTAKVELSGVTANSMFSVAVVGMRDASVNRNRVEYTKFNFDSSAYLKADFDMDTPTVVGGNGGTLTYINDAKVTDGLLTPGSGGVSLGVQDFTFNNGTTVTLSFVHKTVNGFGVMLAKGEKTTGHFEFYVRGDSLCLYAPDIADIDLGVNLAYFGGGVHTMAVVFNNNEIAVWIDGQLESTVSADGSVRAADSKITVGCLNDTTLAYAGQIGSVSFYNRVLTENELKSLTPVTASVGFDRSAVKLLIGDTCDLGFKATGYTFTVDGDAAKLDGTKIKAEKVGTSVIKAVNGTDIQYMFVDVVESMPESFYDKVYTVTETPEEETTEEDTSAVETESVTSSETAVTEGDATTAAPEEKRGCCSVIGCIAVFAVLLGVAYPIIKKKH